MFCRYVRGTNVLQEHAAVSTQKAWAADSFEALAPTFQIAQGFIYINTLYIYTGCPGGNVPDFGRMFLTLKYTNLTQNTYIRS